MTDLLVGSPREDAGLLARDVGSLTVLLAGTSELTSTGSRWTLDTPGVKGDGRRHRFGTRWPVLISTPTVMRT